MNSTHEQALAEQRDAARHMGDALAPRTTLRRPIKPVKSVKQAPKGHEAFLKALEASKATVQLEKASSGAIVVGTIKTSDKYTISIQEKEGTRVLFKHDISEFFVLAPASFNPEVH